MADYFPDPQTAPRHTIFPGVEIRTCAGDRLMLSLVRLEPHSVVDEHQHPHEQMGLVLKGKAVFTIGGQEKTLHAGDWYRIPGNVRHKVVVLDEPTEALDVFTPVREEYR